MEPPDQLIHVGTSAHFYDKENRAPYRQECKQHTRIARHADPDAPAVYDCCWAFSRFKTTTLTPAQLVEHILDGKAWIPSTFGGNGRRTNENWQQAELIALDYDKNVSVADCMTVPLIRDHALLVHPSATSGTLDADGKPIYKTRVIFRRPAPITDDPEYYRLEVTAVGRLLGLPEDECSYKPAQLYYGSTNRIEQPHINLGALLPLVVIDAEVAKLRAEAEAQRLEAERRRAERNYQPVAKDSDRASRKIERMLKSAYDKVLHAPSDRTKAAYDQAYALAHYVTYWALTEDEIERTLLDALTANGAYAKYGSDCLRHIRNGISAGLKDIPEPLELPERIVTKKQDTKQSKPTRIRVVSAAQPADHYANPRHISDELPAPVIAQYSTLLISAPTGMGKTHAAAAFVKTLPEDAPVTAVAPYQLLTQALGAKLDFVHYKDADGEHQRALGQVPQLVSSVSSLSKFNRRGGTMLIDEIEKALDFVSNSDTFRYGQALTEYRALKSGVQSAERLIGMDANLSEITIGWVEALRADVIVKRYSASGRGKLTVLKGEVEGIYQVGKLLAHRRGAVYVACTSENKASQLVERFEATYRVKKVTRDTSNTPEVKALSTNPEARAQYDLIVYDASWGAGVDVSEAVYAHVCLFDRMPLAPEDAVQLFGRVRNAKRRYAALPADSEGYPTPSAAELLADKLTREQWTADKTGMTPHSSGDYLELAQLWAAFEARRRAESATWRRSFIRRIQSNGFSVCENNAPAPDAFRDEWRDWQKARKAQQWLFVFRDAINRTISDQKLDTLRIAGSEITTDLKLCNTRFKIERALGVSDIDEQDRDLMNGRNRQRLFRLSDLLLDEIEVLDADRLQALEGRPIHKRRYGTLDRRTIAALFRLAGHEGTPEAQLLAFVDYFKTQRDASEVEARYQALISDRALRLFKKLGHQGNNSRTVTGLCRWLLDYFGLKLLSRQRRSEGARCMFYQIDGELLAYRLFRARRAAQQRLLSKNVQQTPSNTFLDTSSLSDDLPTASANTDDHGEGFTSEQGRAAFAERMTMLGFESSRRFR